ncbi:putative transposase [Methylococcus capsulatus str. Bath]|uniref:Putative transposase n=1 Tax=Methylococcus capsulatus (strain ATCC 33009 / NCIMB 11132 / Bath) TaxID=243233 RepID=Q60AV8_METCA|nr:putative transposase [Methylococcus capsulatus str. Bath]
MPPAAKTPSGTFKASAPGFLHVDVTRRATKLKSLPQMQDETSRRYLFVAIDRATRWVFIQVKPNKTAAAQAFLKALHKACPSKITKLLTDNGKDKIAWSDFGPRSGSRRDEPQGRGEQFTDRLFGSRSQAPSAEHEFDPLCHAWGIEHRLTPPRSPQANGRVERFNGRIADILKTHHFDSALDLEQTLHRYVTLYNDNLPQSALVSQTPIQSMKAWYKSHPDLYSSAYL